MGLFDQLKSPPYYYRQIDAEEVLSFIENICTFNRCVKKSIFYAINIIQYGGNTLKEIKNNKHKALISVALLKTVQGFKPKVKFKFKSN